MTDPGYLDYLIYPALGAGVIALATWGLRANRRRRHREDSRTTMIREVHEAVMGRPPDEAKRDPGIPSLGHELGTVKVDVAGVKTDVAGVKEDVKGIKDTLAATTERYDATIAASHTDRDDFRATLDDHETRLSRVETEVIPK